MTLETLDNLPQKIETLELLGDWMRARGLDPADPGDFAKGLELLPGWGVEVEPVELYAFMIDFYWTSQKGEGETHGAFIVNTTLNPDAANYADLLEDLTIGIRHLCTFPGGEMVTVYNAGLFRHKETKKRMNPVPFLSPGQANYDQWKAQQEQADD